MTVHKLYSIFVTRVVVVVVVVVVMIKQYTQTETLQQIGQI